MKTRRYCWRVGIAWEQEDGTVCQECGARWDDQYHSEQATCGHVVSARAGVPRGHCTLPVGHEGAHWRSE